MSATTGQQHPIGIYLKIWFLLFVLSTFSYLIDFFHIQGYLRWTLILLFMFLKAGFIVAIFMHVAWERLGAPDTETPSRAYVRLRREMIDAEREVFRQARDEGRITEEVLRRAQHEMDLEESMLERKLETS